MRDSVVCRTLFSAPVFPHWREAACTKSSELCDDYVLYATGVCGHRDTSYRTPGYSGRWELEGDPTAADIRAIDPSDKADIKIPKVKFRRLLLAVNEGKEDDGAPMETTHQSTV